MVLIQPLRFNLSCPPVTALFTVKYIHLQIEDSTPVVDSYFKVLIVSIIVVFTFFRICQEVDIVLGNKDTVEYDDISKLQFVRQTLKESLRKHPPARQQNQRNLAHFWFPKGPILIFPSMLHITYQKTGAILNALFLTGFQTKITVKTSSPTLNTFVFLVDKEFVWERISQTSMLPLWWHNSFGNLSLNW